jgi:hypothetical protein
MGFFELGEDEDRRNRINFLRFFIGLDCLGMKLDSKRMSVWSISGACLTEGPAIAAFTLAAVRPPKSSAYSQQLSVILALSGTGLGGAYGHWADRLLERGW